MMKLFFFFLAFSFAVIPSEINAQGRWLRYRKYFLTSISISNPILTIVSVGVLICAGLKIGASFSRWSWVPITIYCRVLFLISREIPRLSSAIINKLSVPMRELGSRGSYKTREFLELNSDRRKGLLSPSLACYIILLRDVGRFWPSYFAIQFNQFVHLNSTQT